MEPTFDIAPGLTPSAPVPAIGPELLAEAGAGAFPASRDDYLDFALDDELRAAAEAAAETVAAAEALPAPAALPPHAIPEFPKVSVAPAAFLPQVGLLAAGALVVGVLGLATVRPPPAALAPAPVAISAPSGIHDPARFDPRLATADPAPRVRRSSTTRARPVPRVAVPVEIRPATPAPDPASAPAAPRTVTAPVLEGVDQSVGDPPLTGT